LLKINNIDFHKYNSDKVYKIIKKFKIPYNILTKESILNLIINYDKNSKIGKDENTNFLLKHKTIRNKSSKDKGYLYSEKINKCKRFLAKRKANTKQFLRKKEFYESENSETKNQNENGFEIDKDSPMEIKGKNKIAFRMMNSKGKYIYYHY